MARHELGSYVWWRTRLATPRALDDVTSGVGYRFFCWARSRGVIQIRER